MKQLLGKLEFAYDILDLLAIEMIGNSSLSEVQRKVNGSLLQLEEAFEILEKISEMEDNERIEKLFQYIEHGGDDHREWLREALFCFHENRIKPTYKA